MPLHQPPAPRVSARAPDLRRTRAGDFVIHSEHLGDGPPVVLVHGLSGSRRWWRFTAPVLAERYSVHIPDLVGFGGSRRRSRQPDIREMAVVLAEWMGVLGIAGARVIGHSMGGQVSMHLAADHGCVSRLVLVAATGLPRTWTPRRAAAMVAGALPPRAWGAPAFLPTIAADALRAGPYSLLRSTFNLLIDDVRPLLPRVHCPTLVVWGALDPLVPIAHGHALAAGIPGAELAVVPDAAHNVMADRPAEFNELVLSFLARP